MDDYFGHLAEKLFTRTRNFGQHFFIIPLLTFFFFFSPLSLSLFSLSEYLPSLLEFSGKTCPNWPPPLHKRLRRCSALMSHFNLSIFTHVLTVQPPTTWYIPFVTRQHRTVTYNTSTSYCCEIDKNTKHPPGFVKCKIYSGYWPTDHQIFNNYHRLAHWCVGVLVVVTGGLCGVTPVI